MKSKNCSTSMLTLLLSVLFLFLEGCTLSASINPLQEAVSSNTNSSSVQITSYSAYINSDNKASYTLSGTCSGSLPSLTVKVGSNTLGTTACLASGTWSLVADASAIPDNTYTLTVADLTSGTSYDSKSIQKDTVVPSAAASSVPSGTSGTTAVSTAVLTTKTVLYSYKVGIAASTDCSVSTGYSSWSTVSSPISSDISALPDGNIKMCLVAQDAAGNIQSYANATVYTWTKNTVAPTSTLSGSPSTPTNSTSYGFTVGGSGVTDYKFKLGLTGATDCSNSSGYSAALPIATQISGTLASGDGTYKLCVVGKNSYGTWQDYASATNFSWILDTTAPTLAITSPSSGAYVNSSNQNSYPVTSSCSENSVTVSFTATSSVNSSVATGSGACVASTVTVSLNLSSLPDGALTVVTSQTDSASNTGSSTAINLTKDTVAPSLSGTLSDGTYYNSLSSSTSLSWTAATDVGGSGVSKYQLAIGTSSGGTQVLNWTDIGNVITYQATGLSLTAGTTYYPSVRAVDAAGNTSSVLNGNGWIPDVTAPTAPGGVTDSGQLVSTTYSPYITWTDSSDSASGVASYEIRVVDSGNSAVTSWINAGNVTKYGFTGLSLTEGSTYKAEVRAIDNAGNTGSSTIGSGWSVVPAGWKEQAYLKAPNADASDKLGWSVAVDGDTAVVGAYQEASNQTTITNGATASSDNSAFGTGAAYVFKRSGTTWVQEAYLKASGAGEFGVSVSISGDTIVVGSWGSSSGGAAYVFKRSGSTWAQEALIQPVNGDMNDYFGGSVSISGDTIAVGAYGEASNQTTITNGTTASSDNSNTDSGAVYIYKRTGTAWAQEAYIKAVNSDSGDRFGSSVAVSNDTVLVGAPRESSNLFSITNGTTASSNNSSTYAGAAYVYKRTGTTWAQEAYIKSATNSSFKYFGTAVALDLDTAVVASSNEVYVYKRTGVTWAQEAYLSTFSFSNVVGGASLSISNNTIAIGANGDASNQMTITNGTTSSSDTSLAQAGATFIFKRSGTSWTQEAYIKPPNPDALDYFGKSVAVSGETLLVGSPYESSNQTTITNGTTASSNNSSNRSGAAYVFNVDRIANWQQQAYVKAPNADASDYFGGAIAVDGDTMVVGAIGESSNQTTITNGTTASSDNSKSSSGAAYVYKRTGTTWAQEAYLKAPNADASDYFGSAVAISGDTIAIGAYQESSNQTTITNGTTASSDNSSTNSGAVYIFKRSGVTWTQEAYVKPPNAHTSDYFGFALSLNRDTLAVGAYRENSNQTTITNGTTASVNQSNSWSGAVYVFKRTGATWAQEAYIKAVNNDSMDYFGYAVSVSGDTVAVGAYKEQSNLTTITNGTTASSNNSTSQAGAVYVYKRTGTTWAQEAYIKTGSYMFSMLGVSVAIDGDILVAGSGGYAYIYKRSGSTWSYDTYLQSYSGVSDSFAYKVAISGTTIVVNATGDRSNQTTITNGTTGPSNNSGAGYGAAYVFKRTGTTWAQQAYLKAPNSGAADYFGDSISVSGDTVVVGADYEDSNQTTITNGTTASSDNSASNSGAAYIFVK